MITKNKFNEQCITYSQMNLVFNARVYYRRLTTWTRAYIISRYFGIGTAEELFGRLYLESLDIGNMLKIIFGREYSEQYGRLLGQFVIGFRDLLSAHLEGNIEAMNQNLERLYANIEERAVFLEAINPYWSETEYKNLLGTYLQYINSEVNLLVTGDYNKDIELYDHLTAHTNRMGDIFAQGLYDYITSSPQNGDSLPLPGNVECITYDQMNTIYVIRMFWFELVTWIRNYMLSRYRGIGNPEKIYVRLRSIADEYVTVVKQIFGDKIAEDYIQLFYTYIELIDAFITAQMENNIDEINQATRLLYQNAEERAAFMASINPFWDQNEWRNRLYNNLQSTIEESTTLLAQDYSRNIDIFSRLLDQAESTGNYFTQGLFDYINLY